MSTVDLVKWTELTDEVNHTEMHYFIDYNNLNGNEELCEIYDKLMEISTLKVGPMSTHNFDGPKLRGVPLYHRALTDYTEDCSIDVSLALWYLNPDATNIVKLLIDQVISTAKEYPAQSNEFSINCTFVETAIMTDGSTNVVNVTRLSQMTCTETYIYSYNERVLNALLDQDHRERSAVILTGKKVNTRNNKLQEKLEATEIINRYLSGDIDYALAVREFANYFNGNDKQKSK